MTVKDYTKEFYKLDIRFGHIDDEVENVVGYLNGLRTSIQDEINFVKMSSVEQAYLYALKAEEKLAKKQEPRQRTRGGRFQRSRGRTCGESSRTNSSSNDKG